ncbi:calcium/proton exchanger [Tanacetum coccineum]
MSKGQPNKKKSKKAVFTIYLKYDGIFITNPLSYAEGTSREINYINFDGIKELKYDKDVEDMMVMIMMEQNIEDSDCYSSDDAEEQIDGVDFQTEAHDCVVIKDITTSDPFLNKLCSTRALFRGSRQQKVLDIDDIEEDQDNKQIVPLHKVKKGVVYLAFDPNIPWDKMEPVLGMRYESAHQLKLALTNYGVAYGYQLYMKNDWRSVLIYCGRNDAEGRCAGKKGNKNWVMPNKDRSGVGNGEGSSKQVKKSKVRKVKKVKKEHVGNDSAQYGKETIGDPFIPYRKMKDDIRVKYMIDVSLGQCKRAKHRALYDHEGGLIEHYSRLYDYRQAILGSNPGSTCRLDAFESNGSPYFKRMGELLTAMGRDANNQIYPISWAVVRVENAENWSWFLALLQDDLALNDGTCITIISDSHKGLLDAVSELLPQAQHRKCTRHIYANFKKKFSGVQFQKLFWYAACSTIEQQFQEHMEQIKLLDPLAYDYLVQRDPNTMDRRCAAFENGISESFNRAILSSRSKPIITMLEEIRLYIMQRLFAMNKIAVNLEDNITPSIRKRLEVLKEKQRHWFVFPSGFQELEVRNGDESYGVNLQHKVSSSSLVREIGGFLVYVKGRGAIAFWAGPNLVMWARYAFWARGHVATIAVKKNMVLVGLKGYFTGNGNELAKLDETLMVQNELHNQAVALHTQGASNNGQRLQKFTTIKAKHTFNLRSTEASGDDPRINSPTTCLE